MNFKQVKQELLALSDKACKAMDDVRKADDVSKSLNNKKLGESIVTETKKELQCALDALIRFNQNVLSQLNPLPPKEKEEAEEEPRLVLPFDEESSSDSSFSEGEEEEEEKNTKKRSFGFELEGDDYERDDFVVSDSSELEVFDGPEYDKLFSVPKNGKSETKKLRRSNRSNKGMIEFYSDVPEAEQYGDEPVEDLMQDEQDPEEEANRYSAAEVGMCDQFKTDLKNGYTLNMAIGNSPWFRRRYGDIIQTIRDNLGLQGQNNDPLQTWDHVVEDSYHNHLPTISGSLSRKTQTCALCNMKRVCSRILHIRGLALPMGTKCSALISAVSKFYSTLHKCVFGEASPEDTIKKLDIAIAKVQDAHAGKALK